MAYVENTNETLRHAVFFMAFKNPNQSDITCRCCQLPLTPPDIDRLPCRLATEDVKYAITNMPLLGPLSHSKQSM